MTPPTPDDRIKDGFDHLQNAALEVIAALRSFLDVAESVVREGVRSATTQPPDDVQDDGGIERIPVD